MYTCICICKVFDHDRGTFADSLGRVELPGRDFDRDGGYEGSFPLQECGRGHHAYLDAKIEALPKRTGATENTQRIMKTNISTTITYFHYYYY